VSENGQDTQDIHDVYEYVIETLVEWLAGYDTVISNAGVQARYEIVERKSDGLVLERKIVSTTGEYRVDAKRYRVRLEVTPDRT
jgi:hypothetical protein